MILTIPLSRDWMIRVSISEKWTSQWVQQLFNLWPFNLKPNCCRTQHRTRFLSGPSPVRTARVLPAAHQKRQHLEPWGPCLVGRKILQRMSGWKWWYMVYVGVVVNHLYQEKTKNAVGASQLNVFSLPWSRNSAQNILSFPCSTHDIPKILPLGWPHDFFRKIWGGRPLFLPWFSMVFPASCWCSFTVPIIYPGHGHNWVASPCLPCHVNSGQSNPPRTRPQKSGDGWSSLGQFKKSTNSN